ncbi:MAG: DNA polymerase III subunit gamma/tau [Saprospiraceae bacterium]|nr:DNA polymerase III subunit gamma/tau [Saprospiraceae bacterium]MBK9720287.1 DNA polymerase III subunit gamma/tau [Saprospiraceae bacterium]
MDSFVVSARKYRPLKWSDVIGQEHVAHTLKNALAKGQIAHAFLFCGPRGVGKTTCARILAKVLNCESPTSDWEPCNSCNSCRSFMENASFNIFELDAASNNSVEDIRELVDQVRYQPQTGKYKIYIVDEVHMLSTAAFNAFLKTLEEPPPFAKFILATTEKHKIIPTILSRCQIYDFRRIREKDIVLQLDKICKQEGINAEDEGLHLIAQKADGALRDALSMFDRIKSFSGKTIVYKDVAENLNVLDYEYFFKFIDAFLSEHVDTALIQFDAILNLGFDPEILLEGLAGHLRNLMIIKDPKMQDLFEGSALHKKKYADQADACSISMLVAWLDLINEADVNLVRARNKRLHTEILLLKLCYFSRKNSGFNQMHLAEPEKKTPIVNFEAVTEFKTTEIKTEPVVIKKVIVAPTQLLKDPISIPKLGNLDKIKQKIEADEKQRVERLIEFNEENVAKFWEQCKEEEKSNSLKVILQNVILKNDKNTITLAVGNVISREAIRAELKLDEKIRQTFKEKNIKYQIEIDPALAALEEKKSIKILSAKEKWDLMISTNTKLEDFKNKLQLKVDED